MDSFASHIHSCWCGTFLQNWCLRPKEEGVCVDAGVCVQRHPPGHWQRHGDGPGPAQPRKDELLAEHAGLLELGQGKLQAGASPCLQRRAVICWHRTVLLYFGGDTQFVFLVSAILNHCLQEQLPF